MILLRSSCPAASPPVPSLPLDPVLILTYITYIPSPSCVSAVTMLIWKASLWITPRMKADIR